MAGIIEDGIVHQALERININPLHTYKIALYGVVADLTLAGTTAYTTTGEIVAVGYTAGGMPLAMLQTKIEGGTYCITFSDPIWTNVKFENVAGWMIYDSTDGNKAYAIGKFYESDRATPTLLNNTNGTVTLQLPPFAAATAFIRLSNA